MPQSLSATANKGRAGLGMATSQGSSTAASYALQPDSARLVNDEPVLTIEEMEWWRIMEQRKPKKLLRSKFLPQDDVLLSQRTAREQAQGLSPGEPGISTCLEQPYTCSGLTCADAQEALACCAVLCHAVPCCAVPYCAMPCCAVPCCAVPCRAVAAVIHSEFSLTGDAYSVIAFLGMTSKNRK